MKQVTAKHAKSTYPAPVSKPRQPVLTRRAQEDHDRITHQDLAEYHGLANQFRLEQEF